MPVDHDMLVPLSQKGQPSGSYAMMDGMRPDTAYGMTAPLITRRLMYCSHGRYFSLYQQRKPSYTSSGVRRTLGSCVGRAKTRCTAREIAWLYRSSIKQREENVYCSSTARAKGIFITIEERYWIGRKVLDWFHAKCTSYSSPHKGKYGRSSISPCRSPYLL